jgi:hypothetical protein
MRASSTRQSTSGLACDDLHDPPIAWTGDDTYIQHRALDSDLGTYDSPDAFYAGHPSNVSGLKGLAWRWAYSRPTNRNVEQIRTGRFPDTPEKHVMAGPQRNLENGGGS